MLQETYNKARQKKKKKTNKKVGHNEKKAVRNFCCLSSCNCCCYRLFQLLMHLLLFSSPSPFPPHALFLLVLFRFPIFTSKTSSVKYMHKWIYITEKFSSVCQQSRLCHLFVVCNFWKWSDKKNHHWKLPWITEYTFFPHFLFRPNKLRNNRWGKKRIGKKKEQKLRGLELNRFFFCSLFTTFPFPSQQNLRQYQRRYSEKWYRKNMKKEEETKWLHKRI